MAPEHVFSAALGTVARRLFLDRPWSLVAGALDDTFALAEARARVVDVVVETADTRTFVLAPSRRWRGHRAGQHTTLTVEIDGVRTSRTFTIASAPGDPRVRLTIKRVPGGRVSGFLHERVRVGDVVGLGPAAGDFVLPQPLPPRLLFLSGGSGITPVMSMLRALDAAGTVGDLVFVHHARSRADVIFARELLRLARLHSRLRLRLVTDDEDGGFDEARLAAAVPDFAARATFLCGPPGLMARVERMWADAGALPSLRRERFTLLPPPPAADDAGDVAVALASGRTVACARALPLLAGLEAAGERPRAGCRIGICHTCTRTKRRGTVANLVTGAVSSAPDEEIQLCVSRPLSDLEIDL